MPGVRRGEERCGSAPEREPLWGKQRVGQGTGMLERESHTRSSVLRYFYPLSKGRDLGVGPRRGSQ